MHWKVFSKVVIAIIWLLFESVNMIPGRVHPGILSWLYIRLNDIKMKSHWSL